MRFICHSELQCICQSQGKRIKCERGTRGEFIELPLLGRACDRCGACKPTNPNAGKLSAANNLSDSTSSQHFLESPHRILASFAQSIQQRLLRFPSLLSPCIVIFRCRNDLLCEVGRVFVEPKVYKRFSVTLESELHEPHRSPTRSFSNSSHFSASFKTIVWTILPTI